MERRLKCGVCAAAALALVLCFGMEQKTRAMQTAGNAQTTLVIDAGHGGFDGGAVGADGTAEQDINLSIAKRVQVLANFFGVPTAMTRPDENALDYDPSRTVRMGVGIGNAAVGGPAGMADAAVSGSVNVCLAVFS